MALSFVQYAGNGTTATFAIPFKYLDRAHVRVLVQGANASFSWDTTNTIRITPTPVNGAVIEIRRVTPRENPMVDFVDGSVLTETDLDLAVAQVFNIVQEALDIAGGTLELLPNGSYSAGGRTIENLADPTGPTSAVNRRYFDGTFLPQMQALLTATQQAATAGALSRDDAARILTQAIAARDLALQYRDTANQHRTAAAASEANAATQRTLAENAQINAQAARDSASGHRLNAQNAQTRAETARDGAEAAIAQATTEANRAVTARTGAESARDAAAASATAAATWDPASYYKKTETYNKDQLWTRNQSYSKTEIDNYGFAKLSGATFTGKLNAPGNLDITNTSPVIDHTRTGVANYKTHIFSDGHWAICAGDYTRRFGIDTSGNLNAYGNLFLQGGPGNFVSFQASGGARRVYGDGNGLGFLNTANGWAARSDANNNFVIWGNRLGISAYGASFYNEGDYIGFLDSGGGWAARVEPGGDLWSKNYGSWSQRIEDRAYAHAESRAIARSQNWPDVRIALQNLPWNELGGYVFARNQSGSTLTMDVNVAGSSLVAVSAGGGTNGQTFPGTYKCLGYATSSTSGDNAATLFKRVG